MRSLLVRPRHEIQHIELSADGRWLATCQLNYGITVRSTADGSVRYHGPARGYVFHDLRLAFRPDGDYLLALAYTGAAVHDLRPGGQPSRLGEYGILDARFTADGFAVVVATRRSTTTFPLSRPAGDWTGTAVNYRDAPSCPARLSPDATTVLSATLSDNKRRTSGLTVRAYPEWRAYAELALGFPDVHSSGPQFSTDGARVFVHSAAGITVFDMPPALAGHRTVKVKPAVVIPAAVPQPDQSPVPFAGLPCGTKLLMRGTKSRVELRCAFTGDVLTEWRWRMKHLTCLAVSADGTIAAAAGRHGEIVLWDLDD